MSLTKDDGGGVTQKPKKTTNNYVAEERNVSGLLFRKMYTSPDWALRNKANAHPGYE